MPICMLIVSCAVTPSPVGRGLGWRCPAVHLLHEREQVADTPVVGDLAVLDAHDVYAFEVDLAVSRRDPQERPFVRAVIRLVGRHPVAVRKLPVDDGVKIVEGLTYRR